MAQVMHDNIIFLPRNLFTLQFMRCFSRRAASTHNTRSMVCKPAPFNKYQRAASTIVHPMGTDGPGLARCASSFVIRPFIISKNAPTLHKVAPSFPENEKPRASPSAK